MVMTRNIAFVFRRLDLVADSDLVIFCLTYLIGVTLLCALEAGLSGFMLCINTLDTVSPAFVPPTNFSAIPSLSPGRR